MSTIDDDIVSVADELAQAQREFAASLTLPAKDKTRFDSALQIPNDYQTISTLDSQLTTVTQGIRGIAEGDLTFVPLKQLRSALSLLKKILNHYRLANVQLTESPPIHSIDADNLTFVGEDGSQRSIAKELEGASTSLEELLSDWHLLRLAAKSPRINDFATFLRINEKNRENLEAALHDIQGMKLDAETSRGSISSFEARANEGETEIERIKSVVQTDRRTVNEYLAEATTKLEGIRKTSSDASTLAETVNEYRTEFERFQTQLDERNRKVDDGNQALADLTQRLNKREEAIDQLIVRSEAMLVGATNAGLAGSLSKRFIEITKEVSRARLAYYFSILLLICATLPIAFDIIPKELLGPLLKKLSAGYIEIAAGNEKAAQSDLIGHVIARALLLVPALLLVRFAAARHERLFRLREHYAYKYSIASSVEGFKQQSPEQYKDYVALIAFNELTFNPATQMEAKGSETKHLNPLLDAAMRKMGLAPDQQA